MQLIRGLQNIQPQHHGCVASIGNFDGIHLGHQQVLNQLQEKSLEYQLPSVVIIFEPQSKEYFMAEKAPARLTRLREKLMVLSRFNVDQVLCLSFNKAFMQMPAETFITELLVQQLGIQHLIVGGDFHFGYQRRGNYALLEQMSQEYGYSVAKIAEVQHDQGRISSTRIRQALATGDLAAAEQLLGRPYSMCGRVAHGDKRGRQIGFPTANIYLHRQVSPLQGVYAIKLYGLGSQVYTGVANLGNRPTFDGTKTLLEVHLFNFAQDIYGRYVEVEFVRKIRDEQRFESFAALKQQISTDAAQAQQYFLDNDS